MALKVTFEHPDFPKGQEFEIRGLGLIKNGEAATLTAEQEASFISQTGQTFREDTKENEAFKVEGTAEVKVSDVQLEEPENIEPEPQPEPEEDKGGES